MRSMVAASAELSRSLFVPRSTDVIGMGRDWCGAGLPGGAELSRSLFVPRSHDVIGMRGFWRDFFVNAQKWLEKSSLYKFYV